MHQRLFFVTAILTYLLAATAAFPAINTREETVNDRRQLVLENDLVRMVVLPDPGGTVVEFTHKPSGTNFVAGGDFVRNGRLGFGWKDYYFLESPEQLGKGVFALPYHAEFREGPGYKAIYVKCEAEGRRFEREMRLPENSAELTTLIKITNISDKPLRLQARWHSYSTLDDTGAENSCIIAPAEGGQVRKCFIGSGYDHQFIASDGYWLAANYKTGLGMWMTFNRQHSHMQITWTDYNYARKGPTRGMYIAEPHPQAVLAQPGESIVYDSTFLPITAQDKPDTIAMGMLADAAEQQRARQFLATVLPNLAVIGPYTMTPGRPPSGSEPMTGPNADNRFDFSHRRRDRFTLRPWGILDAMMAVPGVQDQTIRCRYYAHLFSHVNEPTKVSYRLSVIDADGKIAQQQTKDFVINPAAGRELDVRDDVAMAALPDGTYRFVLQAIVDGESEPVHEYVETRRLVGQARPAYEKAQAEREAGPLVERPFVTALRTVELPACAPGNLNVPIGVEEGGGIARSHWPVRCGVPFAQGMLAKDAPLQLLDPQGKPVTLQTHVMATWMDGSVKWLLLDFPADVPANAHVFYTLKSAAAAAAASNSLVQQQGDELTVNPSAFAAQPGAILGLLTADGLWWDDENGQRYTFRLQGEDAGVSVEQAGANRAVIKAVGWYYNAQDRAVAMGELRLEHFRGQPFVKLYHTVTFTGDPWREKLGSYGLRLQMPGGSFSSAAVELDGKAVSGRSIELYQRNPDAAELTVDGAAARGRRSIGAVSFTPASGKPLAVYHENFWQLAPKKVEVDAAAGTVSFSYWPREAGAMSFLPREDGWIPSSSSSEAIAVGVSRTQEFVLDFGSGAALSEFEKLYSEPVVAITPPRYLAQTKAMMHLSPYDPQRHPKLEHVISDCIDFYIAQRDLFGWYGHWTYGGLPNFWRPNEYRWLDFGRYAWILNEQDVVEAPWLCYLRSGDRKYLKFATSNTRHLMEVATIRWNPVWPQYVGLNRRHHECIWLSGGDSGHSMLDPLLDYYYATGYQPASDAAARMANGMAQVTAGSWRYISNPVAGLARMYVDTQNPFYKQHADRIWNTLCYPDKNTWWVMDHGDRMAMWYSQVNPQVKEAVMAWSLSPQHDSRFGGADILTALYLETGDQKYAQAALKQMPQQRPMEITQFVLSKVRAWCYTGHLPPPQ